MTAEIRAYLDAAEAAIERLGELLAAPARTAAGNSRSSLATRAQAGTQARAAARAEGPSRAQTGARSNPAAPGSRKTASTISPVLMRTSPLPVTGCGFSSNAVIGIQTYRSSVAPPTVPCRAWTPTMRKPRR